ncbi:MAG TPA: hypothetical protein VIY73_10980, partial [Polyangiaceae bacterium]
MRARSLVSHVALFLLLGVAVVPVACGSSNSGNSFPGEQDAATPHDAGGGGAETSLTSDAGDGGSVISNRTLTGITITPPGTTLQSMNGAPATQQFQTVAQFSDQTTSPVTGATWSRDTPQVGDIDAAGLYTANGSVGGLVKVTASYQGFNATANLIVKLHLQQNPGNVPGGTQTSLQGATAADKTITWAYPYDASVFPRGVGEAPLMWMNGAATDDYYVHLTSTTFELEAYTTGAGGRFDFPAATWQEFTDSTSGGAELKVARWDGTAATVAVDQHWTVAPASMRGTIYYWAINTGRVMRIQAGATAPDDFLGPTV